MPPKNEYLTYLKLSEYKLNRGGVVFMNNAKTPGREMQHYLDYGTQVDIGASMSMWDTMEWRSA